MSSPFFTRRDALTAITVGPALVAWTAKTSGLAPLSRAPDLLDLASVFRATPRSEVLDRAANAIRSGADARTILGATFLAGIQDIRPRHVGGKLHAVLMVESAFHLAAEADEKTARQLALWSLDDFKQSQRLDLDEGDWELSAPPDVARSSEADARREFIAAMDTWDEERADRAIVGLLPHHGHEGTFEILWPFAARSYVNIGHKIIFATQCERTLRRIGWSHAEPVMRSLVYGLLHQPSGRELESFDSAGELARSMHETWLGGREVPEQSLEIAHDLRALDVKESQQRVLASFRDGLGPNTVWDALRLRASELFLARSKSRPVDDTAALLPVHAVTVANAFGHAYRTTRDDANRRLLILQAAGWLASLRDDLASMASLRLNGPPIESAVGSTPAARDIARLVARKAEEHHVHKYAAAMIEESRLVHPRWSAAIQACAIPYLPAAADDDTEVAKRVDTALRSAGIG